MLEIEDFLCLLGRQVGLSQIDHLLEVLRSKSAAKEPWVEILPSPRVFLCWLMFAERLGCREVWVETIDELFVGLSVQLVQGKLVFLLNIFVLIFKLHLAIVLLDLFLIFIDFDIMALLITISGSSAHMMLVLRVHICHSLLPMVLKHLVLMTLIVSLSLG